MTMKTHHSRAFYFIGLARLLLVVCTLSVHRQAMGVGTWTNVVQLAPDQITLLLLLSDGTVMAQKSGSATNGTTNWYRLTPDTHGSYINGTWTTNAAMNYSRQFYASQVLTNGEVFVAGGEYGSGGSKAEIYNPKFDVWTEVQVPGLLVCSNCASPGISDAESIMLPNGSVLIAPVNSPRTTIIYNPALNTIIAGPLTLKNQNEAGWVKLADGSILTIDPLNLNSGQSGFTSERYIPAQNQWIPDANLTVQIFNQLSEMGAGLLLPNGKAIFFGSTGVNVLYTPSGNTNNGTWTQVANVPSPYCAWDNPAAMLVNGKILCLFGCGQTPNGIYEYDPSANTFNAAGNWDTSGFSHCMLTLPDGNILMSVGNSNKLFVYIPDGVPVPSGKPTITSISANADGSYHLVGNGLNGISQGAAFGDDAQMDSNYPLVRLTDDSGNVIYARTYNWSSTGVMTGNTPVSTEFTVPPSVYGGTYSLVVVANGISSDPVSFPGPVWVDFNTSFLFPSGSYDSPYGSMGGTILNPLGGAVNQVSSRGAILIKTAGTSHETFLPLVIKKPMAIKAIGGAAHIGN